MVTQKSNLYSSLCSAFPRVRLMSCILSQLNILCTSLVKSHYTENDNSPGHVGYDPRDPVTHVTHVTRWPWPLSALVYIQFVRATINSAGETWHTHFTDTVWYLVERSSYCSVLPRGSSYSLTDAIDRRYSSSHANWLRAQLPQKYSASRCSLHRSRSFKVTDLGTNRKPVYATSYYANVHPIGAS